MENNYLDSGVNSPSLNNGLSNLDKEYLIEAAKWARFLGIVGFVGTGFVVLAALFMMTMSKSLSSLSPYGSGGFGSFGIGVGILYLLIGLLYFYISLYLFNFGKKTQLAITSNDSDTLTEGFQNLKSFFKVSGIVTAVVFGLYALIFVVGLLFTGLAFTK